jgi:hypothetical protein
METWLRRYTDGIYGRRDSSGASLRLGFVSGPDFSQPLHENSYVG